MNDERMVYERELTDEEFGRGLRMLRDCDVVPVAHLKDIVSWLRSEGKSGMYMTGESLVVFANTLLGWMIQHSANSPLKTVQ